MEALFLQKLTYALYRLAANPQYVAPLREEVEACVARDGWSKAALQKMVKVDSFLREVQRVDGLSYRASHLQPSSPKSLDPSPQCSSCARR